MTTHLGEERLLYAEWRPNPAEHPVWFITSASFPDDQAAAQCIIAAVQEQIVTGMQRHDSRVQLPDIRWWTEDAYRFPIPGPEPSAA